MMVLLSIGFALALLVPVLLLMRASLATMLQGVSARRCTGLLVVSLLIGLVLFARPHQDTFTALDTSDYRLMREAFRGGRGFHEQDATLTRVPAGLRRAFLLEYHLAGRDTRDLAFQLHGTEPARTSPFFYPALPLAQLGLSRLMPVPLAGDLLVPLLAALLFLLTVVAAHQRGGLVAAGCAVSLWLVSPLPVWLLRGAYAEAVGTLLSVLVLVGWLARVRLGGWAAFALGIGVSFHPLSGMLACPVLLLLLFSSHGWRSAALVLGSFLLGVVPLVWMTEVVCQPYGDIFDLAGYTAVLRASGPHRVVAFGVLGIAVSGVCAFAWHRHVWSRLGSNKRVAELGVPVALALALLLAAAVVWHLPVARIGAREAWNATRWGGLVLAVFGGAGLLLIPRERRDRYAVGVLLLVVLAPAYMALKGIEPTGLWSQRRLMPWMVLAIGVLSVPLAEWSARCRRRSRWGVFWAGLLVTACAGAGLSNALRWPAPWLTRFEVGTDAFVDEVKGNFDTADVVFFEYHPHSVPFAVDNRTPALGLGQRARHQWPEVLAWLREEAADGEVLLVTPWQCPGMEDGVAFDSVFSVTGRFTRVRAKTSLPAKIEPTEVVMHGFRVRTLVTNSTLPVFDKVMDGSVLGLRGGWGRSGFRITAPDGSRLPAVWSIEGSQVVGPVPPPGGSVEFSVVGASGRRGGVGTQELLVTPPWGGEAAVLALSNVSSKASVRIRRPATTGAYSSPTGCYTFHARTPYDPGSVGIRGFRKDLGGLIQRVRVEVDGLPGARVQ